MLSELYSLPDEVLLNIMVHISSEKKDFGAFRLVCDKFNRLSYDKLFRHLIVCGTCTVDTVLDTDHIACLQLLMFKENLKDYIFKVEKYNLNVIKYLIENGFDIHNNDDMIFKKAAYTNNLEVVKYLVSNGANIDCDHGYALRSACSLDYIEIAKYLVNSGADIHVKNDSPLVWTSINGNLELMKFLVDHGADIHTDDNSVLTWAIIKRNTEIVDYLKGFQYCINDKLEAVLKCTIEFSKKYDYSNSTAVNDLLKKLRSITQE